MIQQRVAAAIRAKLTEELDRELITPLAREVGELHGYLYHLLTVHKLWSPEGTYTFPDGDTLVKAEMEAA